MNILLNGISLLSPLTGIGQYVSHLVRALAEIPEVEIRCFYGLRCRAGASMPSVRAMRSIQGSYRLARHLLPKPRTLKRWMESAGFLYHASRQPHSCVYHEPNFLLHPYRGPTVVTIADLSCFDHPETHPAERVRLIEKKLPETLARADRIIVISADARDRLRQRFGVPTEQIGVTHLAADHRFHPRSPEVLREFLAPFGLIPGRYVLAVGTLEPRKNLPTLFAAYSKLPKNLRQCFPLVVAGMTGWHTQTLHTAAELLRKRGELLMLGYVTDDRIHALFAGAAVFVYPSRYEGFGLPPLEAMASGVPVIASNCTSLPEVVGDAGILLDPDNIDSFHRHLQQLLEDTHYAAQLSARGLAKAATFSWARCAQETHSVYEAALQHWNN